MPKMKKKYFLVLIVLNALAKDGRVSLFAVADAYNISVSEALHVYNKVFSLGSLCSHC